MSKQTNPTQRMGEETGLGEDAMMPQTHTCIISGVGGAQNDCRSADSGVLQIESLTMSDKTPSSPLQQTAGSLQTMDPLAASARRLAVSLGVLVLAGALFVRMAVSLHPYSGTSHYHACHGWLTRLQVASGDVGAGNRSVSTLALGQVKRTAP